MPAKFYYVLAWQKGVIPLQSATDQPHFLGKTADLSFTTEPDVTIDLDDGTTEVGSEKLSLSFSVLGRIDNPWPLGEIWLVPAISSVDYPAPGTFPPGAVLKVKFSDSEDYRLETKSGAFEITKFSAALRYGIAVAPYGYIDDFFGLYSVHLFPHVPDIMEDLIIKAVSLTYQEDIAVAQATVNRMHRNKCALIYSYIDAGIEVDIMGDTTFICTYDGNAKGIFVHLFPEYE